MVADNRISAAVCSTDLERSREFYEQKLGLPLSAETVPNHMLFEAGDGTTLLVYGRPSPNLADHTQVRFWCADVAADVSELVGRGVQFDLVEFGDLKMVDHDRALLERVAAYPLRFTASLTWSVPPRAMNGCCATSWTAASRLVALTSV